MTDRKRLRTRPSLRPGAYSFNTGALGEGETVLRPARVVAPGSPPGGPRPTAAHEDRIITPKISISPEVDIELPEPSADDAPEVEGSAVEVAPPGGELDPDAIVDIELAEPGAESVAEPAPPSEPPVDPRLHDLERMVDAGRWDDIVELLEEERGGLLPPMGLLCAVAAKEAVSPPPWAKEADLLAIESMARMLGTRPDSPLAVVLAKRAVRRPVVASAWREPPRKAFAWTLILLVMASGLALGWVASVFFL